MCVCFFVLKNKSLQKSDKLNDQKIKNAEISFALKASIIKTGQSVTITARSGTATASKKPEFKFNNVQLECYQDASGLENWRIADVSELQGVESFEGFKKKRIFKSTPV